MGRFALTWSEGDRLRLAELGEGVSFIGREAGCAVQLADPTVSRRHARLSFDGSRFTVENLSQTNPTKVRDVVVGQASPLADHDEIRVGGVRLVFHDLMAGDRVAGPTCSNCGRENKLGDRICWFCGTSLVNAPTLVRTLTPVVCRITGSADQSADLHPGERVLIKPDGSLEMGRAAADGEPAGAFVTLADGQPLLRLGRDAAEIQLNRAQPVDPQPLHSGDEIGLAGRHFIVVLR